MKKPELVPDAKNWWKWWSIRLAVLGGLILTLFEFAPQWLALVWAQLPSAMTATIPEVYLKYVALALIPASIIARTIKQKKLHKDDQ